MFNFKCYCWYLILVRFTDNMHFVSIHFRLNRVFASLTSMNARDKQRPKQLVDNTLWSMEITEVLMKWMSWLVCLDIP